MNAATCALMDDILIVTTKQSELGILWVNYLKTCFDVSIIYLTFFDKNIVHVTQKYSFDNYRR